MRNIQYKLAATMIAGFSTYAFSSAPSSDFNRYVSFNWGECPNQFKSSDNKNLCSLTKVPVNWENPNGRKIEVLVSKHLANNGNAKGQIWFLQGGPGGSGAVFPSAYDSLLKQYADNYDLYVLEHRGVGWSTAVNCPAINNPTFEGYTQECHDQLYATWGEDLYNFNTTNAAKDLDYVIGKSKVLDWKSSYVYGVSYGTLWAQRFTQVAPYGAQGIILDSVVPPTGFGLDLWDDNSNKIFDTLASYCDKDSFCQSKFGNNTAKVVKNTLKNFYNGEHCPEVKLSKDQIQNLGMGLIQNSAEELLMPIYYRLSRCDNNDVIALNNLKNYFYGGYNGLVANRFEENKPTFSDVVYNVIANNEISGVRKTFVEKRAYCDNAVTCSSAFQHYSQAVNYDVWGNKYSDNYIYQDMFHYIPTLALNGDLDPQTPHFHAARIKGAFSNINQRYVEFPYTPHGVIFTTPAYTNTGNTCGIDIMQDFMDNLWSQPNTSCLSKLVGMNYDLPDFWSAVILGTTGNYDEYDGPVQPLSTANIQLFESEDTVQFNQVIKDLTPIVYSVNSPKLN